MKFFTGRNEVVAKVMFLLVSVILPTGGVCLSACWDITTPPQEGGTPQKEVPPRKEAPPRHTVNERPVRILECILVQYAFLL